MTKLIFELENARFFEDVEFVGGDTVKNFVFKKEYVDIHIGVIDIDQSLIPNFVQDTTDQDNVEEPPTQEVALEEQALSSQEHMPLRKSTRERRNAVPNFFQEHEVDRSVM